MLFTKFYLGLDLVDDILIKKEASSIIELMMDAHL